MEAHKVSKVPKRVEVEDETPLLQRHLALVVYLRCRYISYLISHS